jgi:cell division protein FtsQ
VLAGVLVVLLAAHRLVFGGSLFVLSGSDQIAVTGGQHVSADDVISCFAADLGRNIFYIPLHQRRLAIEQVPWVAHAAVLRLWPNGIQVRLTERVPVAFARVGTGIELVDAQGVLLPRPRTGAYNFPVLTDLAGTAPVSDSAVDVQQRERQVALYLAMKKELDAGGTHHSNDFSEIDLHDPTDLQTTIQLTGDPDAVVVHFGHEHFLDRYRLLTAHIQQWQSSFAHLTSIDLRYDGQAIINTGGTPGTGSGVSAAGSAGASPMR